MALFSQTGTLAGVPVTVTPFSGGGSPAVYLEVHNLHQTNAYTVLVQGQTFALPAGRKLVIEGGVSDVIVNGTGDYAVMGNDVNSPLPRLESSSNYTQTLTGGSPADGITLEDTGVVLQVKNLGIGNTKLKSSCLKFRNADTGVMALPGTPAISRIQVLGLPADGETLRIVLGAYDTTFTWKNVAVLPTDILIGIGPGSCALELAVVLNADAAFTAIAAATQLPLATGPGGDTILTCLDYALIQAGTPFANSSGSANVTINTEAGVAEGLAGVSYVQHNVTVDDVSRGNVCMPCAGVIASWSMIALRTGLAPEPVALHMTGSVVQVNTSTLVYYDNYGTYSLTAGDVIQAIIYTRL
ncbi:hypothetical protein UFOVP777_18 [uncultured Caudovirales phage]|uniref:Uncharacterized protein n=1 Tax=uncultured Caudovirales phage TaxID=2100421 RepID=A0A6J5NSV7_9CAUD|nr:hypothetical protein UFOVP777_18 [uncultured Caudovirales phage]